MKSSGPLQTEDEKSDRPPVPRDIQGRPWFGHRHTHTQTTMHSSAQTLAPQSCGRDQGRASPRSRPRPPCVRGKTHRQTKGKCRAPEGKKEKTPPRHHARSWLLGGCRLFEGNQSFEQSRSLTNFHSHDGCTHKRISCASAFATPVFEPLIVTSAPQRDAAKPRGRSL